jgi:predicted ATPase
LPVLAIFTFRPEFEPPWAGLPDVTTLALGRLDQSRAQTMMEQVAGGRRLPTEVIGQILAKTDGIPLFVEELTKAVMESGILIEDAEAYRRDGALPPLVIPATLHDSLMARLDRLAPVKEIAQVGAAIGREFSYALLHAVTGRDEASLNYALSQLEDAELLFRTPAPPDARHSFKHALVQDAAYESLLKSRRQVLHRRIADALRERFSTIAESEPEIVAHHLTQSGLAEAAVEWWGKAGNLALRRSAHNEATAHLERAIGLAEQLSDGPERRLIRLRLQVTYGNTLLHGRGQTSSEAIAAFATARDLAAQVEDVTERCAAYYGIWLGAFARGELTSSREIAEALLKDAQPWPVSPEAGIAHRLFGATCWLQGDYVNARLHLEQALAAHDHERDRYLASRIGYDPQVLTMVSLALVLWPMGQVEQAGRLSEEALRLALQNGHIPTVVVAHNWACLLDGVRRKPHQAAPHAKALLSLTREYGLQWHAVGTFYFGWARRRAGDPDREAEMLEGIELLREIDGRLLEPFCGTLLAEVQADAGRIDLGLATLDAQFNLIDQFGGRWFEAEMHRVRGELLLKRQPPDAGTAEAAFARAIEIARSQQARTFELRAALSLAKLYQSTGRGEAARELLAPAVAGFTEGAELPEVEQANRLLADLAKRADSSEVTKVASQT